MVIFFLTTDVGKWFSVVGSNKLCPEPVYVHWDPYLDLHLFEFSNIKVCTVFVYSGSKFFQYFKLRTDEMRPKKFTLDQDPKGKKHQNRNPVKLVELKTFELFIKTQIIVFLFSRYKLCFLCLTTDQLNY